MKRLRLLAACSATILFAQGCANTPSATPLPRPLEVVTTATTTPTKVPTKQPTIKPSAATYEEYTPEAYQAARGAGQPIFLNFYANWCPFCREQEPRLRNLFETGQWPKGIKGFLVHYNDNETDAADKALAKDFAVGYQHTYIFIAADGKEAKRTTGTTSDPVFLENLGLISQ